MPFKGSASQRLGATGRNRAAESGRTTCARRTRRAAAFSDAVARQPVHTVLYARVPRAEHGAPSVFQATEFLDCARTVHWTPTGGAVHWCMPASAATPSGAW